MSAEGYLTELFCSCVCFPAVLLCYLPMKNRLKYGIKMTLACAGACVVHRRADDARSFIIAVLDLLFHSTEHGGYG